MLQPAFCNTHAAYQSLATHYTTPRGVARQTVTSRMQNSGEQKGAKLPQAEHEAHELPENVRRVRAGIIGADARVPSPFGRDRRLVYADWTASGRGHRMVERAVSEDILPLYGNTHDVHSLCGRQSTAFREEARQIVAQCTGAKVSSGDNDGGRAKDVVIFTGTGATAATNKLVHILGIADMVRAARASGTALPVVLVGPFEHHSNILPWRESGARIVAVREAATGLVDLAHLQEVLAEEVSQDSEQQQPPLVVGAFCAASNVTGVLTDTGVVGAILKRHGALAVWDYATAAPYVPMDMAGKDAVIFSPHKFLGGVNSCGVLIVKKRHCSNTVPSSPGGGTVFYVTAEAHRFVSNRAEREEGGTPDIVGTCRAGLALHLKQTVGSAWILEHELRVAERVQRRLQAIPGLVLLGPPSKTNAPKLPIFSFLVRPFPGSSAFLHYNFVTRLLNDVFGIQARGGCACAGPYAQTLLGMDRPDPSSPGNRFIESVENALLRKNELLRPGFTRISFPWALTRVEEDYICDALEAVARHGWRILPHYQYDHLSGVWSHRSRLNKFPERRWITRAFAAEVSNAASKEADTEPWSLEEQLREGVRILREEPAVVRGTGSSSTAASEQHVLDDATRRLRWFMLPSEARALMRRPEQERGDGATQIGIHASETPVEPRVYDDDSTAQEVVVAAPNNSGAAAIAAPTRDELLLQAKRERKFPRRVVNRDSATVPAEPASAGIATNTGVGLTEAPTAAAPTKVETLEVQPEDQQQQRPQQQQKQKQKKQKQKQKQKQPMSAKQRKQAKKPSKRIMQTVGRAVGDWNMIRPGDRVLVGVSGGKDSLTLLHVLLHMKASAPFDFDVGAVTIDPGTEAFDPRPLIPYMESLGVPYFFESERIFVWAEHKQPRSVCSFCARMKRGRLYACMRREGYNVLALGQHLDDLAESFMMGAFMNGELRAMRACYETTAGGSSGGSEGAPVSPLRVVRPMVYLREHDTRACAQSMGLPVINENCPACFEAPKERRRMKKLLAQQESLFPATFKHLKRALIPLMAAEATRTLHDFAAQTRKSGPRKWNYAANKRGDARGSDSKSTAASEAEAMPTAAAAAAAAAAARPGASPDTAQ